MLFDMGKNAALTKNDQNQYQYSYEKRVNMARHIKPIYRKPALKSILTLKILTLKIQGEYGKKLWYKNYKHTVWLHWTGQYGNDTI